MYKLPKPKSCDRTETSLIFCVSLKDISINTLLVFYLTFLFNLWFSDVFRGYRNGTLGWTGFKSTKVPQNMGRVAQCYNMRVEVAQKFEEVAYWDSGLILGRGFLSRVTMMHSAWLCTLTSLQGSWWLLRWIRYAHWLTSGEWACLLVSGPKLALGQPHNL